MQIVLLKRSSDPDVDPTVALEDLKNKMFQGLNADFPGLHHVDVAEHEPTEYAYMNHNHRDLKSSKKTLYITGDAVWSPGMAPDASQVHAAESAIIAQLDQLGSWRVKKSKTLTSSSQNLPDVGNSHKSRSRDNSKRDGSQYTTKRWCVAKGGQWTLLDTGAKGCILH